jgi:DNA-binding response OmpR family regulator
MRIPVLAQTRRGDLKTKLAASAGQVVTRNEILEALWGPDYMAVSNVVDRHIRSLRAKLKNGWQKSRFIETVPGQGYRFLAGLAEQSGANRLAVRSPEYPNPHEHQEGAE